MEMVATVIYLALLLVAFQSALVGLWAHEHRHALEFIESVAKSGSPDLRELVECIDRLCQRVQAPEVAVAQHAAMLPVADPPQAVSMFDDEDHWAASAGLTKEELADAVSANGDS
jgi:hypothetical protein